jgi:hypothetical protein
MRPRAAAQSRGTAQPRARTPGACGLHPRAGFKLSAANCGSVAAAVASAPASRAAGGPAVPAAVAPRDRAADTPPAAADGRGTAQLGLRPAAALALGPGRHTSFRRARGVYVRGLWRLQPMQ